MNLKMKNYTILFLVYIILLLFGFNIKLLYATSDTIPPRHQVTLREAHIGTLGIDTNLLDSYGLLPNNIRQFYLDSRAVFSANPDAGFTHPQIIEVAHEQDIQLMGGPMLGYLKEDGVSIWLRPSVSKPLEVKVKTYDGSFEKSFIKNSIKPGVEQRIVLDGLMPDTKYNYEVLTDNKNIAAGSFTTASSFGKQGVFKIAFGSCFHKIGLHNPNLINQILKSDPLAMMLLGDIAADDRENQINMHRADYLLRDVSNAWKSLVENIPLYSSWTIMIILTMTWAEFRKDLLKQTVRPCAKCGTRTGIIRRMKTREFTSIHVLGLWK